jgi:hypothetical protein
MDRVDAPITKPLPYFEVFSFFFGKHFMATCEPSENLQYFLKLQKQRSKKRMSLFKEKKTFRSPYFQISYLPHFLFVLNNLKSYGRII